MATTLVAGVQAVIDCLQRVPLSPSDWIVEQMVTEYRAKFGLGPRNIGTERAHSWFGIAFGHEVVAVFGERWDGNALEVTDAYYDGTRVGKIAFVTECRRYFAMLGEGGMLDMLVHTILVANEAHWKAIKRETGQGPYSLVYGPPPVYVFVHRRKGA